MSNDTKRHIISALVTFSTGFLLAILPVIEHITLNNLSTALVFAVVMAGLRGGIKYLVEKLQKTA